MSLSNHLLKLAIAYSAVTISGCSWLAPVDLEPEVKQPHAEKTVSCPEAPMVVEGKETKAKTTTETATVTPIMSPANLSFLGEVEYAIISPEGVRQKARIDTGAQTTSIGITSHELFERDGKTWVLFTIKRPNSDELLKIKRPLMRRARIKRHDASSVRRPVVQLTLSVGDISQDIEVTLAERDEFEYPVLIGRNFLDGKAIVDVSRKFLTLDAD